MNEQPKKPVKTRSHASNSSTPTLEDINDKLDNILSTLSSQILDIKDEISSQIKNVTKEFNDKLAGIEENLITTDRRLSIDIEAMRKENEIIINGIPITDGENLYDIFTGLSSILGFVTDVNVVNDDKLLQLPVVRMLRLKSALGVDGPSSILVKFESAFTKNIFLQRYFKGGKNLTLKNIPGFTEDKRIFIQQNLTKDLYKVHKRALSLKRNNKIHQLKIIDGRIAVKIGNDDVFRLFYSTDDLEAAVNHQS